MNNIFSKVDSTKYLTLQDFNYKITDIIILRDIEKMKSVLISLKNEKMLAFDSEWNGSKTSLFQISTINKTFLFDFNPFQNLSDEKALSKLINGHFSEIFLSKKIIKVSWDFLNDIEQLVERFPDSYKLIYKLNNFIDLKEYKLMKGLQKGYSYYCQFILGKQLDKTHQCCNWSERPLSEEKIIYAALDSISSAKIYQIMSERGINFEPSILEYKIDRISLIKSKLKTSLILAKDDAV